MEWHLSFPLMIGFNKTEDAIFHASYPSWKLFLNPVEIILANQGKLVRWINCSDMTYKISADKGVKLISQSASSDPVSSTFCEVR